MEEVGQKVKENEKKIMKRPGWWKDHRWVGSTKRVFLLVYYYYY